MSLRRRTSPFSTSSARSASRACGPTPPQVHHAARSARACSSATASLAGTYASRRLARRGMALLTVLRGRSWPTSKCRGCMEARLSSFVLMRENGRRATPYRQPAQRAPSLERPPANILSRRLWSAAQILSRRATGEKGWLRSNTGGFVHVRSMLRISGKYAERIRRENAPTRVCCCGRDLRAQCDRPIARVAAAVGT